MKSLFKASLIALTFLFFTSSIGFTASPYNTFKTITYTGNSSSQSITGLGFKPDFVWIKARSTTHYHLLYDSIRGGSKSLSTNTTGAEDTDASELTGFDDDGFTVGSGVDSNQAGISYVAWCWKAGGVSEMNTNGSITSEVSAGKVMSVVKYTGTGTNATIGHGISTAPKMVIVKAISGGNASTRNWMVLHDSLGGTNNLQLNNTGAENHVVSYWNDTYPTDEVFSVGTDDKVNGSGMVYIAYCFAEVEGASSFGSYTGNGSTNGPVVNCGFQVAYLMYKRTDTAGSWHIVDNKRDTDNPISVALYADLSNAEGSGVTENIDFTATGFQIKTVGAGEANASGGTYIYMAFAENEAPQIDFSSDVTSIDHTADPAESATLSWSVSYGDNIAIEPGGFTSVDQSGTLSVTPDFPTTYTLTVTVGEDTFTEIIHIDVENGFDQGIGFSVKGPMGIGVVNPTNMLEVNGTIKAKEVIVTNDGWADHVFGDNYKLQNLSSVENHIKTYRHLPGIPSTDQIGTDGLSVSKMLELQMQKIEELTLYIIELSKENEQLEQRLNAIQ